MLQDDLESSSKGKKKKVYIFYTVLHIAQGMYIICTILPH